MRLAAIGADESPQIRAGSSALLPTYIVTEWWAKRVRRAKTDATTSYNSKPKIGDVIAKHSIASGISSRERIESATMGPWKPDDQKRPPK